MRRPVVVVLLAAVMVVGVVVAAGAATRGRNITACVDDETGEIDQIRLFGRNPLGGECDEGETEVTWRSGRGVAGPEGPEGPEGLRGPRGPAGPTYPTYWNWEDLVAADARGTLPMVATAWCDPGDWATGGGYTTDFPELLRVTVSQPVFPANDSRGVGSSVPIAWEVQWIFTITTDFKNFKSGPLASAYVVCQDRPPVHSEDVPVID